MTRGRCGSLFHFRMTFAFTTPRRFSRRTGDAFMTKSYPDTLTLSRRVLRLLTKLNLLMGALILALLIASLIAESWVMRALGVRPVPGDSMLFVDMPLIIIILICSLPLTHLLLTRL